MNLIPLTRLPLLSWLSALVLGVAALAAAAQTPPDAEAPGRVGRIAWVSGPVDLITEGVAEPAVLNWPLASGQTLVTGQAGRVELRIGSATLRLDADSELALDRIDDQVLQIALRRGVLQLTARNREWLAEFDLTTPHARLELLAPGRYRIEAMPERTELATPDGEARLLAQRMSFVVRAGSAGLFTAGRRPEFRLVAYTPTALDDWAESRDGRQVAAASSRYLSPETPGIEALDDYGQWQSEPEIGAVWYPSVVVSGWAPYRHGRWVWVAPWGWTWIDSAPWGFAPFHYGRWVWVGGRWGWTPGPHTHRPVYAPALVAWGASPPPRPGVVVHGGPVTWVPLGPGEAYRPWYRTSHQHLEHFKRPPLPGQVARPGWRPSHPAEAGTSLPPQDFGRRPPHRAPGQTVFEPRPGLLAPGVQVPVRPDLGRPEFNRPEFNRPDFNRPEPNRPDFGRPEAPRPEVNRPGFNRPEPGRPDFNRPEFNRPEPNRPAPVMPPAPSRPESSLPEAPRPAMPPPEAPRPNWQRPEAPRPPAVAAPALPPAPPSPPPAREEPRPHPRGEVPNFARNPNADAQRPSFEAHRPPPAPAPAQEPRERGRDSRQEPEKSRPGDPRDRRQMQ